MADASDSDSSSAPSSPNRDRDWYVQQWKALCDELGTSDPNEVLARVQTLKRRWSASRNDVAPLATPLGCREAHNPKVTH